MDGDALAQVKAAAYRPQHLLLTLLGDYWYPRYDPLPSAALVDLLSEFGVSEQNCRAALSRMSRKGLLVTGRRGRRTVYALSESAMRTLHEGTRRIFTFGGPTAPWDGRWTVVAFSIPEQNRSVRSALRIRLGWEGFASLFDGVWVAPGVRDRRAAELLTELGVDTATVIVGRASELVRGGDPARAWNLEELRSRYDEFVRVFLPVVEHLRRRPLSGHDALVARTAVIDAWRTFPGLDPELPSELLPPQWPQARARALFAEIYDALASTATAQVREVLAEHDPHAAGLATHHTTHTALALVEQATRGARRTCSRSSRCASMTSRGVV